MRYRENFTLYSRKSKNKTYWYYRTYTPDGRRTAGKSTGKTSKIQARLYCEELFKQGILYDGTSQTFADYATDFFANGSPWLADRMACGTADRPALSQNYINLLRTHLKTYLLPYWSKVKLSDMRPTRLKAWRLTLIDKSLAPKTINTICQTLKIITDNAIADGRLLFDPFINLHPLMTNPKSRDAFTLSELQSVFEQNIPPEARLFALTAACTGLRYSELLAIRKDTLHTDYIDVKDQRNTDIFVPVKTKEARKVPIPQTLYRMLQSLLFGTETELCFFAADGWYRKQMQNYIRTCTNWKERNLSMHSLRHFFNTYLLSENVPPHKVAAVIGHSSGNGSMQERYTNWTPDMFPEVYAAQEKLIQLLNIDIRINHTYTKAVRTES